jgi:hypothetical protein
MVNSFTIMNGNVKGLVQQLQESEGSEAQFRKQVCFNLDAIMASNNKAQYSNQKHLLSIESKLDSLLQLMDATTHGNEELLMAYHVSHEENAILKAAVDDLI